MKNYIIFSDNDDFQPIIESSLEEAINTMNNQLNEYLQCARLFELGPEIDFEIQTVRINQVVVHE